ncbi:hypothetical protein INT47_000835, partial [Mucor saturninus]
NNSFVPSGLPFLQLVTDAICEKLHLPKFDSVYDFCQEFTTVLKAHSLSHDGHWKRLLPSCSNKDTQSWFEDKLAELSLNWKAGESELLDYYDTPYRKFLNMNRVWSMKQGASEFVRSFGAKFQKLRRQACLEDGLPKETLHATMYIQIMANLFNCLNKLPNFKKTEDISEMELTTNYVDPVLSPVLHSPENNKHLIWLNKKEDNTEHLRPDAMMKHFDRKLYGTTLGYCEVKPPDAQKDIGSLCTDLIRLAILSRKLMLRKANNLVCSLQAVGKKFNKENIVHFYVLSKISPDITIMNEIISFDVPLEIKELVNINNVIDDLKKMSKIYDNYCQMRYVSEVEDQDINLAAIVKPKKERGQQMLHQSHSTNYIHIGETMVQKKNA